MKTNLIIITISFLGFICKAQTTNTATGCFVIKANAGVFYDNDEKRLSRGNPNYDDHYTSNGGRTIYFDQTYGKPIIFPGTEIDYYFNRNSFFGINVGLAYSYDKTYYKYQSSKYINGYYLTSNYRIENGTGTGSLKNHLFKFVYSFNFNTKWGLNIYIQPLNPEVRIIRDGPSTSKQNIFDGYRYTTGVNKGRDSATILVSSEVKDIKYFNYATHVDFSIAFPSLIGLEQKFKIGKLNYVAGASAAFSALEWYAIYRVHFGICFGSFKAIPRQPGY